MSNFADLSVMIRTLPQSRLGLEEYSDEKFEISSLSKIRFQLDQVDPHDVVLPQTTLARLDGFIHGYRMAVGLPEPIYGPEKRIQHTYPKVDLSELTEMEVKLFEQYTAARKTE